MNYLVNPYVKKVVLEPRNVSIDDVLKDTEDSEAQAAVMHETGHTEVMELLSFPMEGERCFNFVALGVGFDASVTGKKKKDTLLLQGLIFFTKLLSEEANKFRKEVK